MRESASPPPNAPPPNTTTNAVAAQNDTQRHLTIGVMIDGRGPFQFVVDTGADRTVMAAEVAASLNLLQGKLVMVEGIVKTIPAATAYVKQITFGSITRHDLHFPVLPRALMDADGYLGLDMLDGHRVTLDFANHRLLVGYSGPSAFLVTPPNEARISAFGTNGHLRAVNCRADGVHAAAFIDTGAEVSAGNPPLYAALLAKNPKYAKFGSVPLTGITGGTCEAQVTMIDEIKLDAIDFSRCPVVIADLQVFGTWHLTDQPALLIGMDYLRQFSKVSIDYGNNEIRMDLASLVMARA